eukprot:TRINITY_DN44542_c0_g1_i1.p1 TRINITY_DN44542_c0_g1~~TRINITY_DN44542_c0_g1_i1.p1  ORF type:complete len:452 (-),score=43.86 TRINITY_DN44542_c0_g1_i1:356-1711(-)
MSFSILHSPIPSLCPPLRCDRPFNIRGVSAIRRSASKQEQDKGDIQQQNESSPAKKKYTSSWDATERGGGRGGGADYLYELGQGDLNLNIDTGQNSINLDHLFTGSFLGQKSDIADGTLRQYEFRTFGNIVGDYYIAPEFLDRVTMHIVKNYLAALDVFDKKIRIPLILGVWGNKGCGKSFQTELCFRKLGVQPVIMSAGELEHEWAGTPGKLIRERYRRASEISKVYGKMSCLMINDIDAGIGRFGNTQCTVNNQIVVSTLMNICDRPTQVSIGQLWRENDFVRRTPIIVTGNDLSTVYAPLIRDGRMEKFYWKPSMEDIVGILFQMYKDDGLTPQDMVSLVQAFPTQPLDFFGAIRASSYDNQIRDWIQQQVLEKNLQDTEADLVELTRKLVKQEDLPKFEPLQLTLDMLIQEGDRLAREQELVNQQKLSVEYMNIKNSGGPSILGLQG